jgi:hypothetical protein
MLGFGQTFRAHKPSAQYRLVVGGYNDVCRLWTAYAELSGYGLRTSQLCAFRRGDASVSAADFGRLPMSRSIDRLPVRLSSVELFDAIDLAVADLSGGSASWMPPKQADALWKHLNTGQPVLMAQTLSADQQVQCSRLQLSHKPAFLYTFNFAR